ncbi:fructosamine kinase family protein [Pseudoalteromonas sp. S16_S37]|uniref:fructosamine kinase family protein n=1 Tax=Pseudoalteromonas sp. S16_S37 TaxID=2720228 RepID=UPI00167FF403|nr:fructosamine kinase family protein [Pseudoalteromonas sp. S16_S37]MBD1584569.1 fructosamine kinase family protein [Pseudoalteromonas sp. S16_S37]
MWNVVNQQISEVLHQPFVVTHKEQLRSCDNEMRFHISNGEHHYLVKVDLLSALERFEAESKARDLLIRDSDFLVADTITIGTTLEFSFIVIEMLPRSQAQENWSECALQLAKMHNRFEQQMFGLEEDSYVHQLIQPNQWHRKWETFFAEERIGWQLQLLKEKGVELVNIDDFVITIKSLLAHHTKPSLLHGHFWKGNIFFSDGKPCLDNPACYYGDREVDIAMSELFAPLPKEFYDTYNAQFALQPGYEIRKSVYQLYPLLLHANLYAGDYLNQAQKRVNEILK